MSEPSSSDLYNVRCVTYCTDSAPNCCICNCSTTGKPTAQVGRWWVNKADVVSVCDTCRKYDWTEFQKIVEVYNIHWMDVVPIGAYLKEIL